jgi:hypothetical protein
MTFEEHGLALLQISSGQDDLLSEVRTYVLDAEGFRDLGEACLEKAEELESGA